MAITPVTVALRLPVPPARAFDAFTVGWGLWFARADSVALSARVGAPFFFEVEAPVSPDGTLRRHPHYGRFTILDPVEQVAFTWVTAGTGGVETVVTIRLEADGAHHTRGTLQHTGFATNDARDRHAEAWPTVLQSLTHALPAITEDTWTAAHARFGALPTNRSIPDAAFIPTRSYPDLDAAVAWLVDVLGCRERLRIPGHRVQLTLGNGAVVAAAWDPHMAPASGGRPPATLMVRVPDVDVVWTRALAAGATPLTEPTTHAYGERQASLRDPAGHAWTLTQTIADVDPSQWGGLLVHAR